MRTFLSRLGIATRPAATDWSIMPVSFVVEIALLLLVGPVGAMAAAAVATATRLFASPMRWPGVMRSVTNAATEVLAVVAAAYAHGASGGTVGSFVWPAQGLPIAAAVLAYCFVRGVVAEIVLPLVSRRWPDRSSLARMLHGCAGYFVGAGVAVGIAELIAQRAWGVAPVAAVPLFFAWRAYAAHLRRLEEAGCRRDVFASIEHGLSGVDASGTITVWDDSVERLLTCPRNRALGRTVAAAVPALAKTELPRTIDEVLKDRQARTVSQVAWHSPAGARALQVKVVPVNGGATLVWQDITERLQAESAVKRSEERLVLAAEGAKDGLWEWDLRTQEFYCSSRWKAMLGVSAPGGIGRPDDWFDRVHADDLAPLRQALDAHFASTNGHFEHEHRMRHEDGSYRRFLCRAAAVRGATRRPARMAGSLTDTTDEANAREQLRTAGFLDPLTGLSNRAMFVEGLGRRLEDVKKKRGGRFAVLYLDLDRFKVVNDSLGHLVGDELLVAVSRRLETCLRQGDTLARLGGDEFAILLNGLGDEQQANAISFRIQDALSAPLSVAGRELFISASIGIAFGLPQYANPEEIMRDADTAMYHAKARGKARHELFDADMHARTRDRLGLENDLRHAVSTEASISQQFEVHYQPIVSLSSRMCVGFESLIRWTRNGEPVSPATFVPIAEELGLIDSLGTWVMHHACRTFAEWQRRYPAAGLECVTVNVSSRQLVQQGFPRLVEEAVQVAGLRPSDLRLEITETALMDNPNVAAEMLRELRNFGVKIYLDDFGTGYSSLSHLHKLPVDALKIDRSFVRSLALADRPAIVESILALARTLNTSVVAEGIETDVQAAELVRLGCTHAQGFLFSRPVSAQVAEQILSANQPLGPTEVSAPARSVLIEPQPALSYTSAVVH